MRQDPPGDLVMETHNPDRPAAMCAWEAQQVWKGHGGSRKTVQKIQRATGKVEVLTQEFQHSLKQKWTNDHLCQQSSSVGLQVQHSSRISTPLTPASLPQDTESLLQSVTGLPALPTHPLPGLFRLFSVQQPVILIYKTICHCSERSTSSLFHPESKLEPKVTHALAHYLPA